MATGGFPLNKPGSSSPATKQVMTKEKDLLMRLIYLTLRTCDQLSRDLTKYVIAELCPYQSSNWDDWLIKWLNDKNITDRQKNNRKKKIAMFFGDKIPRIDKCDTSSLTDMLSSEIIPQKNETFNPYIKRLRKFRNEVSHNELETGVTEPEFRDELDILKVYLLVLLNDPISQPIFHSIRSCLGFLSRNKTMSFEQFCTFYPNEITTFIHSLEPDLQKIAQSIPCLTKIVNKHETRLEEIQTDLTSFKSSTNLRIENVETKLETLQLNQLTSTQQPSSNVVELPLNRIRPYSILGRQTELQNSKNSLGSIWQEPTSSRLRPYSISGRETELENLKSSLNNSQLVLIHGPPGIGKTALANYYGQKITSENQVCIEINLKISFAPVIYLLTSILLEKSDTDSQEYPEAWRKRKIHCSF